MWEIYLFGLVGVIIMMTLLWLAGVLLRNVSIVDPFWGLGFVGLAGFYFFMGDGDPLRKILVTALVFIWGLRLSIYLFIRNAGKGEDIRYQNFRKKYGEGRYWWVSYFQTFLLQGLLMWMVSAPILTSLVYGESNLFGSLDLIGFFIWMVGFIFETVADAQLFRFKRNPRNNGKILQTGLWKYTRHPNYFGDSLIWAGFGIMSLSAGLVWPLVGTVIMIFLLTRISGVRMLDRVMLKRNPEYNYYFQRTSGFFPWKPRNEDSKQ